MKVLSQVSTIPGGPEKRKLVLCCSYKRTAAQYLAIYIQIAKPLLGSYITVDDTKKVAKPIPITPESPLRNKKRCDSGYISYFALPPLLLKPTLERTPKVPPTPQSKSGPEPASRYIYLKSDYELIHSHQWICSDAILRCG